MRKPIVTAPIDWPRGVRLCVYNAYDEDGDEVLVDNWVEIESSTDRKYDLSDNLGDWIRFRGPLHLGVRICSKNWPVWDEESVRYIESRIVWDFAFDGEPVELTRESRKGRPCTQEFIWKLAWDEHK
jgi:hypothetical protein